jgi:hypothetical protein
LHSGAVASDAFSFMNDSTPSSSAAYDSGFQQRSPSKPGTQSR